MNILVDYDNVHEIYRNRTLHETIEKILSLVDERLFFNQPRVRVRLYDGWFEGTRISRSAQRLAPQVQSAFPFSRSYQENGETKKIIVSAEMAYCLDGDSTVFHFSIIKVRINAKRIVTRAAVLAIIAILIFFRLFRCAGYAE